jgi:hypothetical protein
MLKQPRKISADEMEALFTFTRQHYVEYYDLQAELADHLANAIEAQWEADPNLSFGIALDREFKKFGIFGFTDIVERRKAALSKRYRRIAWGYFKEFFTLPKIMGTFAIIGIYWLILLNLSYSGTFALATIVLLSAISIYYAIRQKFFHTRKAKTEGRKWMFEEMIFNAGMITFLITPQLIVRTINLYEYNFTNSWAALGFSALFVGFGILQYIMLIRIPKQAQKHLGKVYPEYRAA